MTDIQQFISENIFSITIATLTITITIAFKLVINTYRHKKTTIAKNNSTAAGENLTITINNHEQKDERK